ncbi:MAG: cyclic nucleotide-binding domain-containing protein [Deltaproteobacteria bacterium]|jgi:CRP-like cAMP-binding protein/SAM-dependent methyltransferase|nr:cyclic nucleotide-binding domain-containing protein [Deltaproteobacteria bacterium]
MTEFPGTGVSAAEDLEVGFTTEDELRPIAAEIIPEILPYSRTIICGKQQNVLIQGSESKYLYYVRRGAIEASYTVRGTKIVVAFIGTGNFFGEIGFFDGVSRIRDVYATENSEIRVFDQGTLAQLQEQDPILYSRFLTFLAQSICIKFRRILQEREPLTGYAASLSVGRKSFKGSQPLPEHFFQTSEWKYVHRVVEEFKAKFFDISHSLQEDYHPEIPDSLRDQCYEVMNAFNQNLRDFDDCINRPEYQDFVWGYVFKEIFPYFMRSRFAERAYYKPKGYPGDFLMMEMIYRNEPRGDGKFGTIADGWLLKSDPAEAVRGRREFLAEQLELLSSQRKQCDGSIRIMNLACGSCRELFDFLVHCDYSEKIEALCVDIDPDALHYANRKVNVVSHRAAVRFMNENLVKWSLGRVRHDFLPQDIIYSAGLTDYLDRRIVVKLITRCYEQLKPGGVLVIGNFSPRNSYRAFMDHIVSWRLIYRDETELRELFAESPFGRNIDLLSEERQVNLFAVATKPFD